MENLKEYLVPLVVVLIGVFFYIRRPKVISLPEDFIFRIGHLEDVIPCLENMVSSRKRKVSMDFSQVKRMTKGTFMIFLAQHEKSRMLNKKKQISFMGHQECKPLKSHLKEYLKTDMFYHANITTEHYKLKGMKKDFEVDGKIAAKVVNNLKKIAIKEDTSLFYTFLVELLGNAVEHGLKKDAGKVTINWWLLDYPTSSTTMKYVFVDMGEGIISSYKKSKILDGLDINDIDIPLLALKGELGSSTGEDGRGRGLPQFLDMVIKGCLSDFVLITNNVSLQYKDGKIECKPIPNFKGTYYSWTISKNNSKEWIKYQLT